MFARGARESVMADFPIRRVIRLALLAGLIAFPPTRAAAEGRVLAGTPVSIGKAQSWCVAPGAAVPSWDGPGHPECKMTWRVLAEHGGRVLYSARYAWPSPTRGSESKRVLTEVLFEGVKGSRVVTALYAVQEDEARILPAPLRVVELAGRPVIESRVCMTGTTECGSEFSIWDDGRVAKIEDHTVAELRLRLPKGYALNTTPQIDLASLSGTGAAWTRGDADCCPSATIAFKLRLAGAELHVEDLEFRAARSGS
jgi:hypothetical protein